MVDQELLDLMACPLCRADLHQENEKLHCSREACGCIFRIEDGIPIALIDEAERPCPDCSSTREWDPASQELTCPDCGTTYQRSA